MLTKNIERARRAYALLHEYPDFHHRELPGAEEFCEEEVKDECEDTEPQDMLTDIMHLCELCGFDFEDMLRLARSNYEAERDGMEE